MSKYCDKCMSDRCSCLSTKREKEITELKAELEQANKEIARLKEDISALATFGKPDLQMGWPHDWQEEIYKIIQRAKAREK